MGTAGTGGFANKDLSIGYYNSTYTEIVLALAMFLFSLNFNISYVAFFKKSKKFFKSEELKVAIAINDFLEAFTAVATIYNGLGQFGEMTSDRLVSLPYLSPCF